MSIWSGRYMPFHRTAAIVPRETFAASGTEGLCAEGALRGHPRPPWKAQRRRLDLANQEDAATPAELGLAFERTAEHQRGVLERNALSRRNGAALEKRYSLELEEAGGEARRPSVRSQERVPCRWRNAREDQDGARRSRRARSRRGREGRATRGVIRDSALSLRSPRSS